ncbi:hypothetical protein C8R44DRAFT_761054 [Mycena epipterygia]|nr:hypothetical protein C8R44DRAFT_761054 [Mycena epipterygia]
MAAAIPTENPIILDITTNFGASLVGSWLSSAMWGISSLQVQVALSGETDPTPLRLMACVLSRLLDTTNAILVVKGNWRVLAHQYGRIAGFQFHACFEVVIFVVQIYLIRRIYLFAKKTIIRTSIAKLLGYVFLVVMVVLAAWQFIYQIYGHGTSLATLSTPRLVGLNISLRATAVAVDGTIAICMVYLLTRGGGGHLKHHGRRRLHCSHAGSVTHFLSVFILSVYPDTLFYCIIEYSLCSLYFSTLLANLNTRKYVQGRKSCIITSFSAGRELPGLGGNTHNGTSRIQVLDQDVHIKLDKPDAYSALKTNKHVSFFFGTPNPLYLTSFSKRSPKLSSRPHQSLSPPIVPCFL